MKSLAERQADRVSRKADNCVRVGLQFDTGRGQVGELEAVMNLKRREY